MAGNSRRVPFPIKAKTEEELHRKILKLQITTGKQFHFISFYRAKGQVVGWYVDVAEKFEDAVRAFENGETAKR